MEEEEEEGGGEEEEENVIPPLVKQGTAVCRIRSHDQRGKTT